MYRTRIGVRWYVYCPCIFYAFDSYNYQLCTMMTMEEHGEGQVVQHSVLEANADWHMARALDHFFNPNPDTAKQVQVFVVDKDLKEIRMLQSYFPAARILICTFHVISG